MLPVKIVNESFFELPKYETEFSSGLDLRANLKHGYTHHIYPFSSLLVPTGIKLEIPKGYEAQIRSRSGLSLKKGLVVLNSPGTIDSDYRGEIKVILYNSSSTPKSITSGERIAQMIFAKVEQVVFEQVETLEETVRGGGGFGSTGVI